MRMDLVGSAYEVKVVSVEEFGDHVSSKCETHTAVILAPALQIRIFLHSPADKDISTIN